MSFEAKNCRGRWEIHLSEKKEQREIIIIQSGKKTPHLKNIRPTH